MADADYTEALALRPDVEWFKTRGDIRRIRLGKLGDAVDDYTDAIRLAAQGGRPFYKRGRTYLSLGRDEEAIADFTRAIEQNSNALLSYSRRAWAYLDSGDLESALADAETLIKIHPSSQWGYQARASVSAAKGDWEQARADAKKLNELLRPKAGWYEPAVVNLAAGDSDAYRELCQSSLELHGHTEDPVIAGHIALVCSLAPGGVDDPTVLIPLAENNLKTDPNNADKIYPVATSLYRSGRYDQALARFNEAVERRGKGGCVWDWLFLSMTHHQPAHADESQKWFDQAAALLDNTGRPDPWNHWWTDRLYLKQLRREAAQLLGVEKETTSTESQRSEARDPPPGS